MQTSNVPISFANFQMEDIKRKYQMSISNVHINVHIKYPYLLPTFKWKISRSHPVLNLNIDDTNKVSYLLKRNLDQSSCL